MRTIGGGMVRYVDVDFAPASESDRVAGEVLHGGTIEIVVDGRVDESFRLRSGTVVLVRDGEVLAPGTVLGGGSFGRAIYADIPHGSATRIRLVDPTRFEARVDDVTGLERVVVKPTDGTVGAQIELCDDAGRVLQQTVLPDGATVVVSETSVIRRGEVLARIFFKYPERAFFDGIESLRRFLDAKTPHPRVSPSAPFDGVVESVEKRAVVLRRSDGRSKRIRVPDGSPAVQAGERLRAGDALGLDDRSHHRLLRAWGPERLAEHLVNELERESLFRAMNVPRAYWSLVVRAMLAWRRVVKPGDTGLKRNQVLHVDELARVQEETRARGGKEAEVVTVMRGVGAMRRGRERECSRSL